MTYEENQAGLEGLHEAVWAALGDIAQDIASDMRRGAPVDTGRLRGSIEADLVEPGMGFAATVKIWARTPYAVFVELGTRAHIIRAKNARVLANRRTGQVFGPVVNHPGTKPNPFMRSALYRKRSRG